MKKHNSLSKLEKLIIFARYPKPGFAKTRLIPALGAEKAAELHRVLTQHAIETAVTLQGTRDVSVEVRFTGGSADEMQAMFGHKAVSFVPQCEGTLGDRLQAAATNAFTGGSQSVILVGTDCPDLSASLISEAFERLGRADVVLGPAIDGGYTLIGMKSPHQELFAGIDWGTERVLAQTLDRCRRQSFTTELLLPLSDVDHPEDLVTCRRLGGPFEKVLSDRRSPAISIIIPALNEAANLARTLPDVLQVEDIEVILADGGSTDGTQDVAEQMGVRVVNSTRGRGRQMNAGASVASGKILLFLHADTLLPTNFVSSLRTVLDRGAVAGAFRLGIEDCSLSLRLVEWGANLRSRLFGLPYGDQAIFMLAADFYRLNGFPCWPLMEDVHFCRQLKRHGKIVIADASVKTSSRRWQKLGTWRTTLRNQCCLLAYFCGVAPERIAAFYSQRKLLAEPAVTTTSGQSDGSKTSSGS